MFNLHFTTAVLEQVNKRHERGQLKTKNFQKIQGCQVVTKLVPLDYFKNPKNRKQSVHSLSGFQIQLTVHCLSEGLKGIHNPPALHHSSATQD